MVYLIHFDKRYAPEGRPGDKHAGHYLGSADDLNARLERHRAGNGARLMQVITEAGITWRVARTWEGGRELERKLKNWHNSPKLCPICKGGKT